MDQAAYSVMALAERQVVGFVVSFGVRSYFERRFFREHFVWLAWTMVTKSETNGAMRTGLLQRMLFFRRAIAALVGPGPTANERARTLPLDVRNRADAGAMRVAVHPSQRGQERLQDAFFKLRTNRDVSWVGLSNKPDNKRAIAFYENMGWERTRPTKIKVSLLHRL